ncbi:conserved hypothetical protein [Ricinus communis]|uniref:Uncharacterized protein n=1 Tax=Ricinus communis TaxID=3988 RepID=B9RNJ4_RICCO|nr:conserved hypothetical protein [Ricinus communis]
MRVIGKLVLETDSLLVANWLRNLQCPRHSRANLVNVYCNLISQMRRSRFANLAIQHSRGINILSLPPAGVRQIVWDDLVGVAYFRLWISFYFAWVSPFL